MMTYEVLGVGTTEHLSTRVAQTMVEEYNWKSNRGVGRGLERGAYYLLISYIRYRPTAYSLYYNLGQAEKNPWLLREKAETQYQI